MNQWIQVLSQDSSILKVALKDPSKMDLTVFEKMAGDDYCLRCVLDDRQKGVIAYSVENLINLKDFLEQVIFEKKEGYFFLKKLFECAISVNRNKPVLFDPSFVFVSPYGDTFYFLVVPLVLDEWMFQKTQVVSWVQYLIEHFKTTTAYEILGFMIRFCQSEEFSLPNLISGLENVKRNYYPLKRWAFFKERESFRLKEPVSTLYYAKMRFVPDTQTLPVENKTQLIGQVNTTKAYLEEKETGKKYDLQTESVLIGRLVSCDIRLPDESISLKHALILCENERYYIKDLKSLNRTFLNDKQVIRKMRLHDGMKLTLGSVDFIFRQDEDGKI
ncbi:FHA domain-containing protein [Faecalicoccus pleomorphus]|uniref:FHA domain-containing protein n=1 Tax=Faecalicoccus pleomorphus TaxID=1323 RepID=UPI001961F1E7|nr:FHA domain-containing protein [Faecalicoccus pleomorphus]MBM6678245.1 FHA domain-containing protein [Faecalicoccus pleomorphus]MDB7985692.1 FHA domain-containing protein [Faecalicoccus pleomorphus]MDB7991979.1 FHA domain-containing protein [Faecalicoccus pleomorphus]